MYIAGKNNQNEIEELVNESKLIKKDRIINLGFVEKESNFYKKINILVAPIISGSGTRIKILESLSFGIPVITTEIGAEGLNFNKNFLVIVKKFENFSREIHIQYNFTLIPDCKWIVGLLPILCV